MVIDFINKIIKNIFKFSVYAVFLLFILWIFSPLAYAALVANTDASLGGSSQTINLTGQVDSGSDCTITQNTSGTGVYEFLVAAIYDDNNRQDTMIIDDELINFGQPFNVTIRTDSIFEGDNGGFFTQAPSVDYDVFVITLLYTDGDGNYSTDCHYLLGDYDNQVFSLLQYQEAPIIEDGWLLGSTSPSELILSVTRGVQDTSAAIWPMVGLAGTPIAFTIAIYAVRFIRRSV